MADTTETGDYSDVVSRRKFVSLAGATGAAAVAGCFGDDDGSDGTSDDETSDDTSDDETSDDMDDGTETVGTVPSSTSAWFDTAQMEHDVESYQYNFNAWGGATHVEFGLHAPYTHYDWSADEFHSHLVEDWDIGETEATFTIRDDFTWSDGDDLTAEDLVTQWEAFDQGGGNPLWEFAESVDAPDSTTLRFQYPEGTNDSVVQHAVLHQNATMPPQQWEDFIGSDEALTAWEVEEPISSGPLALDEQGDNFHSFTPRDDHPYADNYNWEGYRVRRRQGNQAAYSSFINQELDGIHSLYAGVKNLAEFPDSIEEIRIPGTFGMAVWFNHDREPWGDQDVRQAFAYSIDLEQVLFAVGSDTKIHHSAQTGLTAAAAETWFGGFNPGGFNAYEKDTDQAQSLLEQAGYDGPGDIESALTAPAGWSDWVLMVGNIADQLAQDGWGITIESLGGAYGSRRDDSDFDLIAMQHSDGAQHNEAYFSLQAKLSPDSNWPDIANYEPDEDVASMFENLATTQDEDEQTQIIENLAEIVNKDLPYFHVAQKYEQTFIDREYWAFPDVDSDHYLFNTQWPLWVLPKTDENLSEYRDDYDIQDDNPGLLKANENAE